MAENRMETPLNINTCMEALELAMDDVSAHIPAIVIESTLFYLNEYKRLKNNKSWEDFPEAMGR